MAEKAEESGNKNFPAAYDITPINKYDKKFTVLVFLNLKVCFNISTKDIEPKIIHKFSSISATPNPPKWTSLAANYYSSAASALHFFKWKFRMVMDGTRLCFSQSSPCIFIY